MVSLVDRVGMIETKRLSMTFAIVTMVILLGSALGSPTFSVYAVTDIHVKSLKDPDNDQDDDNKKCKQDPDIAQDQKHIADIQAEILLDQGHVTDFNAKINKLQADLALDMTNPIKHKNDIKADTEELKHLQDELAKELKDIAGDQTHLAKEIADLNQDINGQKYKHDCDSDKDFKP